MKFKKNIFDNEREISKFNVKKAIFFKIHTLEFGSHVVFLFVYRQKKLKWFDKNYRLSYSNRLFFP